ncbi:MAG: lantibiotic dehydratase family protein [Myxococcota bacterium]|nr:lantibiotic dehydratase family protein [Myxococcota bacterium]
MPIPPSGPARWKLVPRFLLRRAGFPFVLLDPLACGGAAGLAVQVATSQAEAQSIRAGLLRELFPAEVRAAAERGDKATLKALSKLRKRVGRQDPTLPDGDWAPGLRASHQAWAAAWLAARQGRTDLEKVLDGEMGGARAALREIFQRPPVREALWLLSPDVLATRERELDAAPSPQPDSHERALERRLYAFAQRLAAKNETTSFFGPLAYGAVTPEVSGTTFGPEAPSGVLKREAFAAFWAVAALGKAISRDPVIRRALPVRRIAVTSIDGTVGRAPNGALINVPEGAARLFARVDGVRTTAQLAEGLGLPPDAAEALVHTLERGGFLRRDLEPPSTTSRPLEVLRRELPKVPEAKPWEEALEGFEALLRRFEQADLPRRREVLREAEALFEKASGQPARRAAGRTYADRTILYEDCLGDLLPVRMGEDEAARLEVALGPALELGARYGKLRTAAVVTLATQVLGELGGRASFLAFSEALDGRIAEGAIEPLLGPARAFLDALGSRVKAASDGRVARLSPDDLQALGTAGGEGRFASPDVMVMGEGPGPRYVIGEVHPYVYAWGSQNQFAPDPQDLQAIFRADLSPWGGPERLATVLRRRRHKGLVSDAFPGTFIEVTGRSALDSSRSLAIGDLWVEAGTGGLRLMGPRGELRLYAGEDDHPHLRAFAPPQVEIPPVRLGEHTPRIEIGGLVLQRERWQLAQGTLEAVVAARTPAETLLEVTRARVERGWPRYLFALSPTEPKPLCIDLENPFAQSMLQRLLSLGPVTLSEMLPDPAHLWLRRSGGAHTSELRMAMVRDLE